MMELFGLTDNAVFAVATSIMSGARAVLSLMDPIVSIAGKLPGTDGVSTINKNSLEAMAESGKILTMKMWTGYHYKYVCITGMTITKQPYEENIFRATLQLQEVPILNMTKPKKPQAGGTTRTLTGLLGAVTKLSMGMQSLIVQPLVQSLGVIEASGQKDSLASKVKASIGL
jgi:hypothetical protein